MLSNDYDNQFSSQSWSNLRKANLKIKKQLRGRKFFRFLDNPISRYGIYILLAISIIGVGIFLVNRNNDSAKASGPTISTITPNSGSPLGGNTVTINGTNFAQGGPQRIVTITNPGSTVTNYEGNFTLDTTSLITANKLRSDCGDIRIKDSDGTTDLNYWIDGQCNSTNTVVWFKKPSLPAGSITVVLKYADPLLTSQSNIANFSFGGVLASANNKLWLSANNIQTSTAFTPTFTSPSGVTASGGDLIHTGTANSWSNGIISNENMTTGNGYVSARIQEGGSSYRMIGLSKGNSDSNYTDIDFAIYPADGSVYAYESGGLGLNIGSYTTGDILSVEASGDKILYKKNGIVLYTSTVTLTAANYPLLLDTSFYTSGATLKDVKMCIGICDTSSVQTWTDRSGNGNNATQATAANRPILKNNIQNGKPVIRFDGVNDSINISDNGYANNFTILSVANTNTTITANTQSNSGASGVSGQRWLFAPANYSSTTVGSGVSLGTNSISVYEHGPSYLPALAVYNSTIGSNSNLIGLNYINKQPNIYLNGGLVRTGLTSTQNQVNAPFQIGGGAYGYLNGDIPEIILFNTSLSTQDRQAVETYLNIKYNLYGTNPTAVVASETLTSLGVTFGGVPATSVVYVSSTQLTVKVPASTLAGDKTGSVNVVVTNPDGLSVTLTNGYSYVPPTVSSITPNSGSTLGGSEVTINGANFAQGGFQRIITITNPGSIVTNYEGNFTLDSASLISAGKLRSDCGNIRVKDSDGITDLNYWIDGDCNSANTVVWFKKPSLPAGNSTVVLKYGDSALTSQSSISNFSFGSVLTGSNNKLWLSANSGVGTSADGTAIQTWNDRSGNNNNATQATGANRPQIKTNIQNGKPVVRFDNDKASFNFTFDTTGAIGYSFLSVAKSSSTDNTERVFLSSGINTTSGIRWAFGQDVSSYGDGNGWAGPTGNILLGNDPNRGIFSLKTWIKSSSSWNIQKDGSVIQSSITDSSMPSGVWNGVIGKEMNTDVSSYNFRGDISELFIFNTNLNTTDQASVQTYLNTKYNLYGTNPTSSVASETNSSVAVTFGGVPATSTTFVSATLLTVKVPASTLSGNKTGAVDVVVTNPDGTSVTSANGFSYLPPVVSTVTPNTGNTLGNYEVTINGSNFGETTLKRKVTLSNNSTLNDFWYYFRLDTASLISASKLRSDCTDLVVLGADQSTQFESWVQSGCNTSNTIIWAKISQTPTNPYFYVGYGGGVKTNTQPAKTLGQAVNNPGSSCLAILNAGKAVGNDWYYINPSGSTYLSYCDFTTEGGGWSQIIRHPTAPTPQNPLADYGTPGANINFSRWSLNGGFTSYDVLYKLENRSQAKVLYTRSTNNYKWSNASGTESNYTAPSNQPLYFTSGNPGYYGGNYGLAFFDQPTGWCGNNWHVGFGLFGGDPYGCNYYYQTWQWGTMGSPAVSLDTSDFGALFLRESGTLITSSVENTESESQGLTVSIGGNLALSVRGVSSTELKAIIPPSTLPGNKTGSVDMVVTNSDGSSGTLTNGFTYAAPVVSSISPNSGPVSGGTFVTVTGSNFSNLRASGSLISRYITVTNPGSTITNYEGNITLDTASLITANKLRSDCGDIRIKDSDGTTDLNYWIDGDYNSSNTVVWFKKPSLAAGNSTVVLKYGDSALTSQSNIANFSFGGVLTSSSNKIWISGNTGTGVTTDGATVTTWNDRTGNNNNFTGSTTLKTGSNGINGKPIINFNGAQTMSKTGLTDFQFSGTNIFAVSRVKAFTTSSLFWSSGVTSGDYINAHLPWSDQNLYWDFGGSNAAGRVSTASGVSLNTPYLWNLGANVGGGQYVQRNSSTIISGGSQATNNITGRNLFLGSCGSTTACPYNGDIAELVIFKTALNSQDQNTIQTYLNTKYNLYGTNPAINLGDEANYSIAINGQVLGGAKYINPTTLTGYVPAGTGTQNVTVTNSDGTSGTLNSAFTYGVNGVANPIFDLAITSSESENIPLSWTAPFNNGSSITDYIIKYSTDNFTTETVVNDGANTNTSYTVTGLTPGLSYKFKVIAVNGVGNSLDSNIVSVASLDCDTNLNGGNLSPANGATLTGRYCNIGTFTVASGFTVNTALGSKVKIYAQNASVLGTLSANNSGYTVGSGQSNGNGPGGGVYVNTEGAGGGYGGSGGNGAGSSSTGGVSYGSITEPIDLGSGGSGAQGGNTSNTGNGGGLIKLNITGTLTNNGSISANGQAGNIPYYRTGGGSGGSIWITANTLAGTGSITTNGGAGGGTNQGGGGAGGRIALYYNTKTLSGSVTASGSAGAGYGGAGTIYEKLAADTYGTLKIDNNGAVGAVTPINSSNYTPDTIKTFLITNSSVVIQDKTLTVQNTTFAIPVNTQFYQNQSLAFTNSLTDINITGYWESKLNPTNISQSNLTINSGGNFTTSQNTTVAANLNYKLDLTFNNLTINSGGQMQTNTKGYTVGINSTNGNGPGGGVYVNTEGAGGGYGGSGGNGAGSSSTGGVSYGSITEPIDLGSGGSGAQGGNTSNTGNGGGAIKLNITETLTNNGTISANGQNGNIPHYRTGGGSGGSIWITTNTLAGTGSITANGGAGGGSNQGGGGGGGRIALYYNTKTLSGSVTATGGTGSQAGGAGTVYEPNTPQVGLTDAVFSPNPNPISAGSTFTTQITTLKNTLGYNLYSGTCSINITGPSYSQSYTGTVNTGVCTISGTYPAPTVSGSGYTAAISVTGTGTQTKNMSFSVATAASNKAKLDTGILPVYTSVVVNPANPLIGTNYTITGSGFVDSSNNQALNGIACTINITGPNSYANTFATGNIVGGVCSYNFDSNSIPKVPGTYVVSISLAGNSATLTTNTVNFNYYFDIYLTNGSGFDLTGKIPGTITSTQSSVVQGDPDPVFTSPVIRRYDNVALIPSGTACAVLVTIASGSEVAYTSTTNSLGKCAVSVPNNSFTGGSLSLRNRVTILGNDFYTNPNTSILIQNFPSNKAKADTIVTTQPKLTAQTSSPIPTFIGASYTLSVSGLEDSLIGGRPLANLSCVIIVTGPNSYTDTQTVAITNGTCSKTYTGNTPQIPGQYSFKVQVAGDSSVLETPTVNFNRFFNIKLVGGTAGISGTLSGATATSQNPILLNTATTLTSPVIRNYADNANITGLTCRNVLKINSGSDQFYNGTLNGSGQCVTVVPSGNITAIGTAYFKTQISAINSDYNSSYTFENANTVLQIRNPPTSQICANATFRDDNKNGVRDGAEPLLAGVVTRLKDASNTTILNTLTTTGSGPNCFTGLYDDTYYIQQVLPTGGTLQTASLSYQVILGVATIENRSFGYNGDAVICPNPTFIDINENGVYESGGGDYYISGLATDLYLTSDLNTSLEQITTNAGGTVCFTARNPNSYTIKQTAPDNTASTTGTITSGKVSQNVALNFGTNLSQKFGYRIVASQKAKPQASPNQTKPVYTSIIQLTSVNPTYNEKAFVNYPASATISGLVDSNTSTALNGTGICSATFSGPSFASPVTVSNLNVVSGSCVVNNTNNSAVVPTSVSAGNSVQFTLQGPTGSLISDIHTFEVFSGNSNICPVVFADYNLNGNRDTGEPYLAGIQSQLFKDNGVTLVETITSNINGTSCFSAQAPGILYTVVQTAPTGAILTAGTLTNTKTPFPETTTNFTYPYKGDSTITPSAFRDDNRNGINNSESALNGIFTVTLKDYAGNVISSNVSINGTNQFTNLLSTSVLGGNYTLQVSTGSLVITNTTNNNPATVSSLNNGSNQNISFGYANDAAICPNPSFYDYNKNGVKDGSEPNINNLATRLLKASDNSEIATLNTTGSNCFTNVIPDNYIIEQTYPIGAVLTTTPGTQSGGKITVPVTATFGVSNTQVFGYKGNTTICPSPTFQDLNKNGVFDGGEPLISGLNTVLKDMSGVTMQTLSTNGSNCFTEVLAGNFQVVQSVPSNSTSTTGGATKNVSVSAAQSLDVAFGYNGEPLICPTVYRDDNGDGSQNNGESSLEGSTLTLKDSLDAQVGNTILSNGTVQCFNPLAISQNYTVTATSPSGFTATTSLTASITATFGQRYTPSFGFNGNATVCVTNSFNDLNLNGAVDSGESSIAGLTTKIRVNGSNTDIQSLTTDSGGHVCFTPLPPGQYRVLQTAPVGSGSTTGGDQVFTLTPAQSKNIIFGYSGSGAICVELYNDADFNGRKDAAENRIPDITAELYLTSNLVTPISTKTTNSATNVCFTQLQGGNYQVKIITIGYLDTNSFASTTGGATQNVTLAEGNIFYATQSFGYTNNTDFIKGAFRGLVYMDRNENGEYNTRGSDGVEATVYDNDIPIVEKQVDLLKDSGGANYVLQTTQITNSLGEFNFLGLDPGNYKVQIANDTGIVGVTFGNNSSNINLNCPAGSSASNGKCVSNTASGYTCPNGGILSGTNCAPTLTAGFSINSLGSSICGPSDHAWNASPTLVECWRFNPSLSIPSSTCTPVGPSNACSLDNPSYNPNQGIIDKGVCNYTLRILEFSDGFTVCGSVGDYLGNNGCLIAVTPAMCSSQINTYGQYTIIIYTEVLSNTYGNAQYSATPQYPTVTPISATRSFTITSNEKTYDLYGFQYTAQICPSIYVDKNNNGIPDGTDIDLIQTNGLYVQLEYQSYGGTQIYGGGNANGILLNSANPCITKVPPRNYALRLSSANNLASIFDTTYYSQRNPSNNPSTTIYLGNTTTPTIRYYTNAVSTLSSISGKVWNDRQTTSSNIDSNGDDNKTGVENLNSKNYDRDYDNDFAYANLSVSLRKCGPVAGETIGDVNAWNAAPPTTSTDSNGDYSFSNIPTGAYAVVVNTSTIPYFSQISTYGGNSGTGCNNPYDYIFFNSLYYNGGGGLVPGANTKYDIIYYYTPTVNAKLWIDTNKNGIKDGWEDDGYWRPYSSNLELNNTSGIVDFNYLKYFTNGYLNYAQSVLPNTYSLTILNNTGNSNIPSSYSIIGNSSQTIDTTTGSKTVEYGLNPTQNSTISGRVFIDRDGDNNFEPDGQDGNPSTTYDNDTKLPNKTINLYYGSGQNQFKTSTVSDSEGNYQFTGLAEGIYYFEISGTAPSGSSCTSCSATIGLNKDQNYNQNLRYNYDSRIRLMSFYDTIANYSRDDEFEVDVNEGTFTLIAPDGSQVGSPVSPISKDNNGSYYIGYQFNNLAPGTYTIQMNNMPSAVRGYSNPDTIVVGASQSQERDYPFTAQTNNTINGDVFIDKQQGVNQGLNSLYNPNGGDNNAATLIDNDQALTNTEVKIIGPLGTYTTNTNSGANYSFSSLPSGKYKLYKLINNGVTQVPNITLDTNNTNLGNLALNSWGSTSWLRNATTNNHNVTYRYTNEVSAYCYDDKDLNGQITYYPDSNTYDRRSGNCAFEIETSNGEKIPLDSTSGYASDPNGSYTYGYYYKSNLPPGSYILRNTNNQSTSTVTNFTRYEPSTLNYGITREANVNFAQNSLNQVSRANMFLNFSPITNNASIIGQVYIDRNNNGIYEPNGVDGNPATLEDNDVPLKNVAIYLSQNPVNINRNTRTDDNGNYQITDLPRGSFKLDVDLVQK
ncbi:MAG: DUF2341 domain-containing protein [bacterium]